MSFGWSAGDIAAAITLAYNLIQALDTCDGAAGDYREAVSFLQDLKRTLEPLQAFTASNVVPGYGTDIEEQVAHIKEPVEAFLAVVLKYEPNLGAGAEEGHHRHIFRKLQWYMFMSKKVLSLRKKIESHTHIIDTLMHRLTIDSIRVTQQQLPEVLRATLQQTLRPELIAILQENLPPLNASLLESCRQLQTTSPDVSAAKWNEQYERLSTGIRDIKEDIRSSSMTQMRIESCIRGHVPRHMGPALLAPAPEQSGHKSEGNEESVNQNVSLASRSPTHMMVGESLREVYYLVFLYLGHFLKNLFLVLSRLVQPTQALMPVLLPQYNLSFLDAFGRPPRILPFEYFRSFKILQAFIQHEFKDFPGSTMVGRGKYLISNLANSRFLDESNWSGYVAPGSTIAMSMVVHKRPESPNSEEERCPESSCPGMWTKPETQSWVTCPVCQKQIITFPVANVNDEGEILVHRSFDRGSSTDFAEYDEQGSTVLKPIHPIRPGRERDGVELELEEDISHFKRIVQEIHGLRHNPSKSVQMICMREIAQCLARFSLIENHVHAIRAYITLQEPVRGTGLRNGLIYIEKSILEERLAFERTMIRLLSFSTSYSESFPSESSSAELREEPMNSISVKLKQGIVLHEYKLIAKAAMAVSRTLYKISNLFPDNIENPYRPTPIREVGTIADLTKCIPSLVSSNRDFIMTVDLAVAGKFIRDILSVEEIYKITSSHDWS